MSKKNKLLFFLCLFFLIAKTISIQVTNFDLFGDEAQYWLWSQNLDLGYYSKPPLLPWIIALVCSIFGNSIFVIKMISVFIYCLIAYVVFLISKKLVNNTELSFLTAISFFLIPAVSFSSFLISTDILLVLFWSLALLQLLTIKENPIDLNFILLGMFMGLSFLAKYAAIYFVFCMVLLLFEKEMKSIFIKNKISLLYCILTFGLVVSPNIIWNINNDWTTFGHTVENAALERTNFNLIGGVQFATSQIIMIGPLIFLCFIFGLKKYFHNDFNTRFLLIFSLPIFIILLCEGILVRANANWAAVSLVSFLILFVHTTFKFSKNLIFFNNLVNLLLGLCFFFLIATNSTYEPFKRISGISSFAKSLADDNVKQINRLVVGDRMLFSNLGYIFHNSEIKMYTPFTPNTKKRHHFQITNALPPNFDKNFIFIGQISQLNYLKNKRVANLLDVKVVQFKKEPIKIYEVIF